MSSDQGAVIGVGQAAEVMRWAETGVLVWIVEIRATSQSSVG